ncbi:MAG: GHKL domain-containing protein [Clostridiales bacterium]|nr:GHKL domain-containing protein [Clostridiales bacterium]
MSSIPDIPRIYTALAEWLACVSYISLAPKRRFAPLPLALICAGSLVVQSAFLMLTDDAPFVLWVPCMLFAIGLMFLLLYLCTDTHLVNVGFCCVRAFLLAEFAASLEWQLYYYCCTRLGYNPDHGPGLSVLFLVAVYAVIYVTMWQLDRQHMDNTGLKVNLNELIIAFLIGAGAFGLSNLSYVAVSTPFSTSDSSDIPYIRTLVDLAGVAILYAYHIQRVETYMRYELTAINTTLKNQYDQYRTSRESIDLINRKYHDLKHQIAALRAEPDAQRRNQWLDEMESDIRQYEAQNKTGNPVLDTVLTGKSLYCQKHGITLTCVADAEKLDFMRVMDICSIFGNALDNAIESALQLEDKEQRLIRVSVGPQKGFLLIRVENYFGGSLTFEDGLPVTTKKDKDYHGFGVKSIKRSVEQYNGAMTISTDNGWFRLKLLIPLPEEDKPG